MCVFRPILYPNFDEHILQSKGLRFSCTVLMCILRVDDVLKIVAHRSHSIGFLCS
jgi:hypothetical protein